MRVLKRDGTFEQMSLDKITDRLVKLADSLDVDCVLVAQKACAGLRDGIATSKIDEICGEVAVALTTTHPDFETLAARIVVSDIHKKTKDSVLETFEDLANYVNDHGERQPLVSDKVVDVVRRFHSKLQSIVEYERDYEYTYFGLKTLMKGYLHAGIERPQHGLLRASIGIWGDDIQEVIQTYKVQAAKLYTHATPSLFNLGTPNPHSASCYLLGTEDSLDGLADTFKKCSLISKGAGGIGLNVTNVRGSGALIRGTGGHSNGLLPLAQTFNMLTRWVNQGGKRNGAIALYLEPWHVDVYEFVQLRRPQGAEDLRARNIFLALWLNDLFMERVLNDGMWSLMDPDRCKGLIDAWGNDFRRLYEQYESEGRYSRQVRAQDLWTLILSCQIESGMPYLLNKDAANATTNQRNLGTIRCSNLCAEVIEFSDHANTSVCNLASIALPRFVSDGKFDHSHLHAVVQRVVKNLDHMLDMCIYPVQDAASTNLRDRPLGIGVQGLADTFIALRMPFESAGADRLNRDIFETMYHAAITASIELAEAKGCYESYDGSPASQGLLQFDLWDQREGDGPTDSSGLWDWGLLRSSLRKHGLRNSLLLAAMPTCSTSQILGCNESFQPINSNIYTRRTGAGTFVCINTQLVRDLKSLGIWGKALKDRIIVNDGSVQGIAGVPQHLQDLYKTVWEIRQKSCINLAARRGPFICQSQSMNLFLPEHSMQKLSAMLVYAWKMRLITMCYYCHIRVEARAVQVTTTPEACENCSA